MRQDKGKQPSYNSQKSKKKSREQLEKLVSEWQQRAYLAEKRLSSIACIPNDSKGWLDLREREAREALREILDEMEDGQRERD